MINQLSFIKAYHYTLLVLILCLAALLTTIIVAAGCMGGAACDRMVKTTWIIAGTVGSIAFILFLKAGCSFLRSNIKKVILMSCIWGLLMLPALLWILVSYDVIVF
jgi:hypothetical protein